MFDRLKRRLSPEERAKAAKERKANEGVVREDGYSYGPSPEAAEALREHARAERQVEDTRAALDATGEELPVCELHGWNPPAPLPGAPRPPKSRCPDCRAEAPPSGEVEVIEVEHPAKTKQAALGELSYSYEEAAEQRAEQRREQAMVEQARANPDSWVGREFRTGEGRSAASDGRFLRYLEARALEDIDKSRARDRANLLETHPDFPRNSGPFNRRSATPGQRHSRRAASSRYWAKHGAAR